MAWEIDRRKPWMMVSTDSPASPDPVCSTDLLRSPSPCLNLDALSSDDAEESVRPHDILVTLLCGSEDGHTPVNSDQVFSDVDLQSAAGSRDRRQVFRTHDLSPVEWYSRWWVSVGHPKDSPDERIPHSACVQTPAPEVRPKADNQRLSAAGPSPVVGPVDIPDVGRVETIQLSSPQRLGQLSPESPQTIAFEDMGDSSVPLSPNRVQMCRQFRRDF